MRSRPQGYAASVRWGNSSTTMITLCFSGHPDIAFEGRDCPLCKVKKEFEARIETIKNDFDETLEELKKIRSAKT
jgi:hypothetical protein